MQATSLFYRIASVTGLLFVMACGKNDPDPLKTGFLNPPDSAKPGVYWYFLDGNINREQMTADLESLKEAGFGHALFLEVDQRLPRGKVDFLSPEWQELFKHAVREAERLGIRIVLGTGPGWTGSGGPWVRPEQSMQFLVSSSLQVKGPSVLNRQLPLPGPYKPYSTPADLPDSVRIWRDSWYSDVAVLAFPTPRSGLLIGQIGFKALYDKGWYSSQAGAIPNLPAPAGFAELPGTAIDPASVIDLSGKLQADGSLNWDVPAGHWTIIRFGRRNNGILTRPAPVPGVGMESDKFDTVALQAHYQAYISKLIEKVQPAKVESGGGWTMLHIDSWEIGTQNWSGHFREEFIRRRGYDPIPYLPAFTGRVIGSVETSERFLWDIRQTSKELIVEYHGRKLREMGNRDGFRLSIEPYDQNPSTDLDLGGEADVPMSEFWSDGTCFQTTYSSIEAVSLGHVLGKPVVAAEAFTACDEEAWRNYPGMMKNQGDWAFAMGINRFFYHTFVHRAHGVKYPPGLTLGPWGLHWDRSQTWWPMVSGYNRYIARCQFIMSQGTPVSEVLYLTPEGAPTSFRPPPSATDGTAVLADKKGYSYDGCSPVHLMELATVSDHRIVFPGGASYGLLVLTNFETMTPQLVDKIGRLVEAGARVVGPPPVKSPSLENYPECDREVADKALKIWGTIGQNDQMTAREYGLGQVFHGGELLVRDSGEHYPAYALTAKILGRLGIKPDFTSGGSVRYGHRTFPGREVYFIANRTGAPVEETCLFRDGSLNAEIWDPLTGGIRPLHNLTKETGGVSATIKFEAFQSYLIVFYPAGDKPRQAEKPEPDFPEYDEIMTIDGPWKVAFDPRWGGPEAVTFETLADWSKQADPGIRFYSGIATYSQSFDLKEDKGLNKETRLFINLGVVKDMARIRLNGRDLGVVWTEPWQVEITEAVKSRGNRLEIEVANRWPNRLIGDELEPDDGVKNNQWPDWLLDGTPRPTKRYTFTTYRYYKAGDPLLESGLMGPVRIVRR